MPAPPIGELLRRLRLERDLTLEVLAQRSGVSDRSIGDIERGVSAAPRRGTLAALAEGLALPPSERAELLAAGRRARTAEEAPTAESVRPHRLADFTGREQELELLVGLLRHGGDGSLPCEPIVVSGAPGSGKTSLALEAVRTARLDDRELYFVNLGGATDRPLTPLQVLQALLRQVPGDADVPVAFDAAAAAWQRAVAAGPAVVVLDDAGMESQVRPVLAVDRRSRVVTTSRRSLAGLEGVRHVRIGPLPRDASVTFLRRAIPAAQLAGVDVDELAELCGDLPLALRIVAGRIASQPGRRAAGLVDRLRSDSRRLRTLTAGDLAIETTFAAAYALLTPQQQWCFRALSVLPASSFSAAAAAAFGSGTEDDAVDELEELAHLGLVEPLDRERFRLHDPLRLFAAARLREDPDDEREVRERARRWYAGTAARAGVLFSASPLPDPPMRPWPELRFDSPPAADAWLQEELDGWTGALFAMSGDGAHEQLLVHVRYLRSYAESSEHWHGWPDLLLTAVTSARAIGDQHLVARHLADAAWMLNNATFDHVRAKGVGAESIAAARAVAAVDVEAQATLQVAIAQMELGEDDRATQALFDRAVDLHGRADDAQGALDARIAKAAHRETFDPTGAADELRALLVELARSDERVSDRERYSMRLTAWVSLGRVLTGLGEAAAADAVATEALDHIADRRGAPSDFARLLAVRGHARAAGGDAAGAITDLGAALDAAGAHRPQWWADEIEAVLRSLGRATA
ncbi:ATP-binding protein [Amnibacterium kyonggiense]|uniref:Transcriptional regulator with XRE-family HTH domain n=1 Tax=Amnibacterium kyonggiense TaxID=595671 RepID=A0A4R7FSP3_9MICO|nr:ATP-binding protein [Amnibacterium kyonggiense]TDS80887.1 transcriptional regulator with XRE-family HTH domain [Amnibacterium kyonggiense]